MSVQALYSGDKPPSSDDVKCIADLVDRARAAMGAIADADQTRLNEAVTALAWSLYDESHATELAEIALHDSELGNIPDKIDKVRRKTFGTLRDLMRVSSTGIIEEDIERGIVTYAKPVGVVAAICPSTNPASTAGNKAMMAIKGGNAIILAPSPLGYTTTAKTAEFMRQGLEKIGLPIDLVQIVPLPIGKARTGVLMEACDLVVATGSADNVERAARSGTPDIGVGTGNVPVIVDASADIAASARAISASKTYDNSTSCSSENALVILDRVYDETLAALAAEGGHLLNSDQKNALEGVLWQGGKLNRDLIARDIPTLAKAAALGDQASRAKFFLIEESDAGPSHPFSGEKLSLVLTIYRAGDFDAAIERINSILAYQGKGHSCGIHTGDPEHARKLAALIPVARVLVNHPHALSHGGSFENALPFTQSMGCGTWGGNSISENLNYRHFLNLTNLVTKIPMDKPAEDDLFGDHWEKFGK